ncbi:(2Fe-2S)-binding protein [Lacihabitans sp. CCS-44]|uniref:(2Fe-2S)-binding protein n=1 Tax=Lacihabitans sp. CCS-44 TaxID=2487331 RepID=UPI0020CEA296|nr:(2Fe-2S)-binding protein [Lacihabitans sp. CCS-44]MCP9757530.1 (2Fe-2S)-binding protein [Lacihabitans sp. CCS-44]
MTRYEFLKSAGFTGASLMTLLSCVKTDDSYVEALVQNPDGSTGTATTGSTTGTTSGTTTGTSNTTGTSTATTYAATNADKTQFITTEELNKLTAKLKIDLTSSTYTKLKSLGGYVVVSSSYVVALSKTGKFIAATVTCSHEPKKRIIYSNEEWYCTDHGARFSLAGKGLNSNGSKGLTIYKTATDGNTLIIY